jgi:hypothetical protein
MARQEHAYSSTGDLLLHNNSHCGIVAATEQGGPGIGRLTQIVVCHLPCVTIVALATAARHIFVRAVSQRSSLPQSVRCLGFHFRGLGNFSPPVLNLLDAVLAYGPCNVSASRALLPPRCRNAAERPKRKDDRGSMDCQRPRTGPGIEPEIRPVGISPAGLLLASRSRYTRPLYLAPLMAPSRSSLSSSCSR